MTRARQRRTRLNYKMTRASTKTTRMTHDALQSMLKICISTRVLKRASPTFNKLKRSDRKPHYVRVR